MAQVEDPADFWHHHHEKSAVPSHGDSETRFPTNTFPRMRVGFPTGQDCLGR